MQQIKIENFFHGMINHKRRSQAITGIMHDVTWISDPSLTKDAFLNFYKDKFQAHDSQVIFSSLVHDFILPVFVPSIMISWRLVSLWRKLKWLFGIVVVTKHPVVMVSLLPSSRNIGILSIRIFSSSLIRSFLWFDAAKC